MVRREFSTQMGLYKAIAYANDHGSWLSTIMASMSSESSHLLESIIAEKLHRRFSRPENGRIGWLPPVAEEKDFICVFDCMELPYAIRLAVRWPVSPCRRMHYSETREAARRSSCLLSPLKPSFSSNPLNLV